MPPYTLRINGAARRVEVAADTPLLWVLRDTLGLTGTKFGCGQSLCGACTVHLDGTATRSCVTTVAEAARAAAITTIEGLSSDRSHPVQKAWIEEEVPQCGYCQPGMIMSVAALLKQKADPSDAEVDQALGGHICRCGTYQRIRAAVKRAARNAAGPQGPRQGGRRQVAPAGPGGPKPGEGAPPPKPPSGGGR
jgi:isoquinoline 1-oxidoreductase alpha subunit